MALPEAPFGKRLRSKQGWADAASYTVADLTMLRRELLVGFTVAGFLAVLVPSGLWNAVFVHGHGFATTLENAVVGPFIAIISFVCSIGNVPLAAALWKGGISFGGVVSVPLRRSHQLPAPPRLPPLLRDPAHVADARGLLGRDVGCRLATEEIFRAAGLVPNRHPARSRLPTSPGTTRHTSTSFSSSYCVLLLRVPQPCASWGKQRLRHRPCLRDAGRKGQRSRSLRRGSDGALLLLGPLPNAF